MSRVEGCVSTHKDSSKDSSHMSPAVRSTVCDPSFVHSLLKPPCPSLLIKSLTVKPEPLQYLPLKEGGRRKPRELGAKTKTNPVCPGSSQPDKLVWGGVGIFHASKPSPSCSVEYQCGYVYRLSAQPGPHMTVLVRKERRSKGVHARVCV